MEKSKLTSKRTAFDYLGLSIYLFIWCIITFTTCYEYPKDEDYLVRMVSGYIIFSGIFKIITSIFCIFLYCGSQNTFIKCMGQFVIFFTRLIDAVPTIIYAYKGIVLRDPMAFLFLFPKVADTFALWVMTGGNGVVKPCYFCLQPEYDKENEAENEVEAEEIIELKKF